MSRGQNGSRKPNGSCGHRYTALEALQRFPVRIYEPGAVKSQARSASRQFQIADADRQLDVEGISWRPVSTSLGTAALAGLP
jgi:hypothetical protein